MLFWGEVTHIDITRSGFELVKRVQALLLFSMTLGLSGKGQGYQTEKTEEKLRMWVSEFQSGQSELGGEDRDSQLEPEDGGNKWSPHTSLSFGSVHETPASKLTLLAFSSWLLDSEKSRKRENEDFSGDPVDKNLPANAGDTGSIPDVGISHIPWSNKPVLHNYWAQTPKACALQQERPQQWEAHTAQLEKSPHSKEDPAQPKINFKKERKWCHARDCYVQFYDSLFFPTKHPKIRNGRDWIYTSGEIFLLKSNYIYISNPASENIFQGNKPNYEKICNEMFLYYKKYLISTVSMIEE